MQLVSALVYNLNLSGYFTGSISKSATKAVCVPGLNCYSCPGAVGACPLGSLQAALNNIRFKLPLYVVGTLLIFGVLFGRAICAFLCPFGLVQELLYKIPTKKIKKSRFTRALSGLKYVVLAVFVIALPLLFLARDGVSSPAFCKYICPAGTLGAGIPLVLSNSAIGASAGSMFIWKVAVLAVVLAASVFIFRPFCRFICPLGAIYSFFNRVSVLGVKVDRAKCTRCNACVRFCKLDVKHINDRECIRCGECAAVCPENAVITAVTKRPFGGKRVSSRAK